MNELIIRLSGAVEKSNFAEFKEAALAEIRAANKELVTDTDFAEAEAVIKTCKAAEVKISNAKTAAMENTEDIRTLFADLDSLSSELARTRLALEKQVKTEKERRKIEVINSGISSVVDGFNGYKVGFQRLNGVDFKIIEDGIRQAVSGKKTIEGMVAAVEKEVAIETNRLRLAVDQADKNMSLILSSEADIPGLYPDKATLCKLSPDAVVATIESRVAKFRLDKELARQKKEAEAQKEAKAFNESNEPVKPEMVPVSTSYPEVTINATEEKKENFYFLVDLYCTKETAVSIATQINGFLSENKAVTSMKLSKK